METSQNSPPNGTPAVDGPSPKFLLSLFGGFGMLALFVLAGSWSGYQLSRHTAAAESALASEDYARAAKHLEYITEKYPKAWLRQVQYGDAMLELEKPEEALKAYDAALEENPEQNLKARLGRVKFLLGEKNEAIKLLKEAIEKDANDARANYYIGQYYMGEGNYARAAFFFEAAGSDPKLRAKSRPQMEEIKRQLLGEGPVALPKP